MTLEPEDSGPTYIRMASGLRQALANGEYRPGERFPSVRTLAAEYGVANATAARAVGLLRRAGVIASRPGVGTVVRDPATALAPTLQEQLNDLRRRVAALEARNLEA